MVNICHFTFFRIRILTVSLCLKVRVGFSHHVVDLGADKMEQEKALCFLLDTPSGEPEKKKRKKNKRAKPTISALTFGSKICLSKLSQCKAFQIAWRVRRGQLLSVNRDFVTTCQS